MEDALPYIRNNIWHCKVREPTVLTDRLFGDYYKACAIIRILVVDMHAQRKVEAGWQSIQDTGENCTPNQLKRDLSQGMWRFCTTNHEIFLRFLHRFSIPLTYTSFDRKTTRVDSSQFHCNNTKYKREQPRRRRRQERQKTIRFLS